METNANYPLEMLGEYPAGAVPSTGYEIWDTDHGELIAHCSRERDARQLISDTIEDLGVHGVQHWALVKVLHEGSDWRCHIIEMWGMDGQGE